MPITFDDFINGFQGRYITFECIDNDNPSCLTLTDYLGYITGNVKNKSAGTNIFDRMRTFTQEFINTVD
jgi:hypothetical protein